MEIELATLNVRFEDGDDTNEIILGMEQVLRDAAESADADEFDIAYEEKEKVLSISIPFEAGCYLELLEAGAIFGVCKQQCMDSDLVRCLTFWNSVNAIDGSTIASPI